MQTKWYLLERSTNRCCTGLTFVKTQKRLMPAKINVTSHISLHTWSRSHEVLPKSWRTGNYTGHWPPSGWQQNTYEANILCCLTFKVFQKYTFFRIKHLRPPSPKWKRRTALDRPVTVSVRGITRLDGSRGKKQVRCPPPCSNLSSFWSKFTVLKKVLVTLFGLFGTPRGDSVPKAVIRRTYSDSAPGELCPPFPLVTSLVSVVLDSWCSEALHRATLVWLICDQTDITWFI